MSKEKIPEIPWKGRKSPEEVTRLNRENPKSREFLERGEHNRNTLLEGIDEELIGITRKKAHDILAATGATDLAEAETKIDTMIASKHPKIMMSIIHETSEEMRRSDAVNLAAIAAAFIALTESPEGA